ncbi:PREDICTED: cleavage and polyadenylation specificity factor subunit 2-like [Amphimedon queenslandica]|uniref:Cleavage and polyadenylation specificity factor subunit 2 n=2 Tax=Amphimedon queenslandica TaxID=400682 RepID=A0A1X7VLD2_AMPQE|nr:PREDICTED: cleavage and polyadenylation specificity factor subunit 2-like [Amphimedon queenslandica]|eukprot:XP_011409895.2 PREDICTED: cleavage and polyadenylation specificity factor subunit 2-like [Amphimedon queenslandica]
MTSIIKFTALSGAKGEGPPCYLLQVDEFCFLLDCGWDEFFSPEIAENIKKHIHQIDAVLLSHPDVVHLGALPYVVGRLGLRCPVYATIPVYKMGQMFMYDLYQARHNSEEFDLFSLDDVDQSFDLVVQVKYSQTVQLKGKGHGLTITPYPAGHMVGGTIWKIVKDGEEEIVYAVDYNHKKERHLDGAVFDNFSRPHLLITDAYNALSVQARRKERDKALLDKIVNTLRKNGNVLIAVDTAGRVLELSQLLDQMWRHQELGFGAYSIVLLSNVSYNVVEFAKSQVEWMSEKLMRTFEDSRTNPFQFQHINLCHNLEELAKVSNPKAVLVSPPDLECGFSRDLFLHWSNNPHNSIIFTSKTAHNTLARTLVDNLKIITIDMDVKRRVPLEGAELEEYLMKEKEKAKTANDDDAKDSDESDEEMEVEGTTKPTTPTTPRCLSKTPKYDLMMTDEGKAKSSFFKQTKSFPMYHFKGEKIKWDEYGEPFRHEDYQLNDVFFKEDKEPEDGGDGVTKEVTKVIPTKCVSFKKTVPVRSSLSFIDFEGRSDGDSIKRILTIMKPRQLILIHGSLESTKCLVDFSHSVLGMDPKKVFAPAVGETIDATTESQLYIVKLTDALMSGTRFAPGKDAELAWVDGQIRLSSDGTDSIPVLDVFHNKQVADHKNVFINPPRLSDFKNTLTKAGIQAEFCGGALICNGVVAIKRTEGGKISIEGSVSDDYYLIRKLLYEQFAIV